MNHSISTNLDELTRIKRVADMMVTAHALLTERYKRLSLISDVLLFACAVFLCAMAFADQDLLTSIFGAHFTLFLGLFAIATFIYSFFSNGLNWKIKAERHKQAYEKYCDFKFESNDILKRKEQGEAIGIDKFLEKYHTLTPTFISIPEKLFLKCKKKHKLKVAISQHLDQHPGTSIFLFRAKLWFLDNIKDMK